MFRRAPGHKSALTHKNILSEFKRSSRVTLLPTLTKLKTSAILTKGWNYLGKLSHSMRMETKMRDLTMMLMKTRLTALNLLLNVKNTMIRD